MGTVDPPVTKMNRYRLENGLVMAKSWVPRNARLSELSNRISRSVARYRRHRNRPRAPSGMKVT
jgi:hypothetical protein